jgi:hypothetical protein
VTAAEPPAAVSEPDPRDSGWQALAQELAPAKSLARIDAVTSRIVTNVSVVGTILTALGLLAAGLPTTSAAARGLALAAVVTAVAAVGCALTAQILTIFTGLNTNDLDQVKAWYARQFHRRAYPTRAATLFLLLAILLAGGAAAAALLNPGRTQPVLAIIQTETITPAPATSGTRSAGSGVALTVDFTFRDLTTSDVVTLIITATTPGSHAVIGRAAITSGSDGTAARSIIVNDVPRNATIDISATGGQERCQARLDLAGEGPATVRCGEVG